jgi:hypothetical protein
MWPLGVLFLLYLLTIKAVIKQTCITLYIYFIFRQVTVQNSEVNNV